jgi:hypothetical protein
LLGVPLRRKDSDRQQQIETAADDLTQWLLIERETILNALAETISRFPQFESPLREMAAFCKIDEALPDRELTPEEESRAVAIGRGVVKAMLSGRRMGWNEALEWTAAWIENTLLGESNERAIEFGRNMAMSLRAAKKSA